MSLKMPKRVKFRKLQRGVIRGLAKKKKYSGAIKGYANRGNYVAYGDFGLQSLEGGWLSAQAIEAARITITRFVSGEGRYYMRVFPHKSVTSIPAETRMGKGKGEPEYWAAVVKPGLILFEIGGVPESAAKEALAKVAYKMPFKCRFVHRRPNV
jgi:large subunit ribosomal protein L16